METECCGFPKSGHVRACLARHLVSRQHNLHHILGNAFYPSNKCTTKAAPGAFRTHTYQIWMTRLFYGEEQQESCNRTTPYLTWLLLGCFQFKLNTVGRSQYPTLRLFELWFSERLVCSHCLLQHVFLFGIPWMLLCEARFFVSYSCRCLQIVWNFLYTTLIRDRHAWN